MWDLFLLAALSGFLLLYLPGTLINRALRFDALLSFIMAPATSCLCISILGIIMYLIPVELNGFVLIACLLVISVTSIIVSAVKSRKKWVTTTATSANLLSRLPRAMTKFSMMGVQNKGSNWILVILYASFAFLVVLYMFLGNIASSDMVPASFALNPKFDSIFDYSQTSMFSIVAWTIDSQTQEMAFSFQYIWQILPSIIANITGIHFAICFNATLAIFLIFVIPLGIFGFLSIVFHNNRLLVATGSVIALSFAIYPWHMLLFPDQIGCMMAIAFVPGVFIAILGLTIQGSNIHSKLAYIFLLMTSIFSMAISYPNIIFMVVLMCVPYVISRYFCWVNDFGRFVKPVIAKIMGVLCCLSVCFLVWIVFTNIPVEYSTPASVEPVAPDFMTVLCNICLFSLLPSSGSQLFLGAIALCGAMILFFKKGFRWLASTWLVCILIYMLYVFVPEETLRYTFGFWHVGLNQLCGLVCLSSIPLVAIFSATIIRAMTNVVCSFVDMKAGKTLLASVGCIYLVAFICANVFISSMTLVNGQEQDNTLQLVRSSIGESYIFEIQKVETQGGQQLDSDAQTVPSNESNHPA